MVRDCCSDWVPKALERGIELEFDAPLEAVRINGNEILLRELISNLLDNAVTYGKSGGHIDVKINIGSDIRLTIENDGPSINPTEITKIFERFYRIPGSPGEGCGLGLAIVKEIANQHRAQASIHNLLQPEGVRVEILFRSV